jgi:CRISPR-associated protein (TIGR03986 family)
VSIVFARGPAWAARSGDTLTAEMSYRGDGKKAARRTWQRSQLDPALTAWFAAASDGDQVEVFADIDSEGRPVQIRMAHPPVNLQPAPDQARLQTVEQRGGGANPYTFIPALLPEEMPPGLGEAAPETHGVIDPGDQWSGFLVLRLETQTPMLLPDPEAATRNAKKHATYPVRLGVDGKPLLHGASVKGALRSAYEAVTGSRFAVFRSHESPLAYRRPASDKADAAARVESDGNGGLRFRICKPIPVPLYDPPPHLGRRGVRQKARATGAARDLITREGRPADWGALHGKEVWYATRLAGQAGNTREVVREVTLTTEPKPRDADGRGWLSVTGRSIELKASERLFVDAGQPTIPVEDHHHALWHAVLASYRDAAEYSEPGTDRNGKELARSRHVVTEGSPVPERLAEGDLVYLDLKKPPPARVPARGQRAQPAPMTVTVVHPVMIGRLPYSTAPSDLLHESLHPARELSELSPADRLFGWAPGGSGSGRRSSSGYRGRVRVESVTCTTTDWLTSHDPSGVTLAPLSSPKPTQFRFYAASDAKGSPIPRQAEKGDGYTGGIRGRKAYWYPNSVPDGYWAPGAAEPDATIREWQDPSGEKTSQNSTHLGWVKKGTEFTVRLFIDAASRAELAPLIWLATLPGCPLRLGAGKPLGFGAVTVSIDWPTTELRTGQALRDCWLDLARPEPAGQEQIQVLAAEFDELATDSPVLAPAVAAWRRVTEGLAQPIHYPRTQQQPEAETYRWFVANEQIEHGNAKYGFALPHVLEGDQRLPHLPPARDSS